jgi:hypothetical protein
MRGRKALVELSRVSCKVAPQQRRHIRRQTDTLKAFRRGPGLSNFGGTSPNPFAQQRFSIL